MARQLMHEKPKDLRGTLKFLGRYFGRHRAALLLVCLLIALGAGANVYGTYLFSPATLRASSAFWFLWA